MKRLIRMLKFAHAAEIAAYHAYEGHWRSVSNKAEQDFIRNIALDELKHIQTIRAVLVSMKSKPSKILDVFGKIVGETIGMMCYYSGWRLPLLVAGLMEKIGTSSYRKIAFEAADNGMDNLAWLLLRMADKENEHEAYFKRLRVKNG